MNNSFYRKIKDILKRKAIKDIFTLQMATFINQGINIVVSIIIARLLGVEGYGIYALIFVFTGLISLANLGYTRVAVVLLPVAHHKKDSQEVLNILSYLFKINLFFYLPLYILLIIFAPLVTDALYHNPQVGDLARLVIISMLINSFASILNLNLEATRKMNFLAIMENSSLFLKSLLVILFLFFGLGLWGVAFGYLLSAAITASVSFVIYFLWSRRNEMLPSILNIIKNVSRLGWRYNLKFSASMAADNNLGKFLSQLPLFVLSLIAPVSLVGFYKIALSYVNLPHMVISSISRLLNVKFAQDRAIDINLLKKNFYRSSLYFGVLFIVLLIIFAVLASWLIPLLYGNEFKQAVNISYWLAIALAFTGFTLGFGPIYRAFKKTHLSIIFNVVRSFIGLMIFVILFYIVGFSVLTSVLAFKIFLGPPTIPIHFWFIKKKVLDKFKS